MTPSCTLPTCVFAGQPKDWTIKMNKQERRLALATALQSAAKDMIVVESLAGKIPDRKTKSLVSVLTQVGREQACRRCGGRGFTCVKLPCTHARGATPRAHAQCK